MRVRGEWLETFLAVVDAGSFTVAAQRVHRTQSAVSQQLRRLEESLGSALLERHAHRVALTAAGEQLLPRARRAVAALHAVTESEPEVGPLRLGLPEEYAEGVLPLLLGEFRASHPSVTLRVTCAASPRLRDQVTAGELDLALVIAEEVSGEGQWLARDPVVWVTGERSNLIERRPLPLALFDRACSWRRMALDALAEAGVAHDVVYISASVAGVRAAVRAGIAVGLLGRSTVASGLQAVAPPAGCKALPASELRLIGVGTGHDAPMAALRDALQQTIGPVVPSVCSEAPQYLRQS